MESHPGTWVQICVYPFYLENFSLSDYDEPVIVFVSIQLSILLSPPWVCQPAPVHPLSLPDWMRSNRLQLNTVKTEILWCSTTRRQNHLPSAAIRVGENHVLPSTTVRDLGVLIDSDVAMRSHVSRTVSGCYAVLRQLRSITRSVSDSVYHSLVVLLVMPRLDYCNATLAGLPTSQLSRLQSVLNAAARLIHRSSRYDHFTPMLRDLHWLRSPERIDFKLAVLAYRCLHGLVFPIISRASPIPTAAVTGCRHPRS